MGSRAFGVSKPQTLVNGGIAAGYIGWYPGLQASSDTVLSDRSGNGKHAAFGAGLTTVEAWATASCFSTVDSTAQDDAIIAIGDFNYSYNAGEDLIVAFGLNAAAPAGTETLMSSGSNSTIEGLRLIAQTSGKVGAQFGHSGGTKNLSDSNDVVLDSTWHSLLFAHWGHNVAAGTSTYAWWNNGANAMVTGLGVGATSMPSAVNPIRGWRIGGIESGVGTYNSMTAKYRDIHILRFAAGTLTEAKLNAIALRLHRMPFTPLTAAEVA